MKKNPVSNLLRSDCQKVPPLLDTIRLSDARRGRGQDQLVARASVRHLEWLSICKDYLDEFGDFDDEKRMTKIVENMVRKIRMMMQKQPALQDNQSWWSEWQDDFDYMQK